MRWLDENHEDAAIRARLRDAARAWERSGHAAGLLWTGKAAQQADTWHRHYRGGLTAAEQRYLSAVLAAAAAMRAHQVRRRLLGGIVSATVLFAIAMAWLAWKQTRAGEKTAEGGDAGPRCRSDGGDARITRGSDDAARAAA